MKINEFCERLYDKKDQQPSKSVGVSKEMREFIASELARANEEALRLKQDEIERQKDRFIPYHPINCDESCRSLFSLGPSLSTLERKDQRGVIPNNTDQQYLFFYGWSGLVFALFVVFAVFSSYPVQDSFTMSVVVLILISTLYLLLKDWVFII
jgi:hypothetical protein